MRTVHLIVHRQCVLPPPRLRGARGTSVVSARILAPRNPLPGPAATKCHAGGAGRLPTAAGSGPRPGGSLFRYRVHTGWGSRLGDGPPPPPGNFVLLTYLAPAPVMVHGALEVTQRELENARERNHCRFGGEPIGGNTTSLHSHRKLKFRYINMTWLVQHVYAVHACTLSYHIGLFR